MQNFPQDKIEVIAKNMECLNIQLTRDNNDISARIPCIICNKVFKVIKLSTKQKTNHRWILSNFYKHFTTHKTEKNSHPNNTKSSMNSKISEYFTQCNSEGNSKDKSQNSDDPSHTETITVVDNTSNNVLVDSNIISTEDTEPNGYLCQETSFPESEDDLCTISENLITGGDLNLRDFSCKNDDFEYERGPFVKVRTQNGNVVVKKKHWKTCKHTQLTIASIIAIVLLVVKDSSNTWKEMLNTK
ncbi:hypothetical protein FQR65_LT01087 [Abscondita terminalis]|nr:hypothetical protein FQR65_LT01087 [Abscondita terminalis]